MFRDVRLLPLAAVEQDLRGLAEVLGDCARGAYMVTQRLNVSADRLRIDLEELLASAGRQDEILIYISSHGFLDQDGQLFFSATDTDVDRLLSSAIEARLLSTLIKRSPASAVVLLLDCCHSGAFGLKSSMAVSPTTFEAGRGRVVLTATTATELAWEGKRVSVGSGMSVFTHYVVSGIRSGRADVDGDGQISVRDLFDYVWAEMTPVRDLQVPTLIADEVERFPIIAAVAEIAGERASSSKLASRCDPQRRKLPACRLRFHRPITIEFVPFGDLVGTCEGHVSVAPISEAQLAIFLMRSSQRRNAATDLATVATGISWFVAQGFCDWLSDESGLYITLPTLAEYSVILSRPSVTRVECSPALWEWCGATTSILSTLSNATADGIRRPVYHPGEGVKPDASASLFPGFWFDNVGFRVIAR